MTTEYKHEGQHLETVISRDAKAELGAGVVEDEVAAKYLDSSVVITPEENIRLRRKIYKYLLPVMCLAYVTQSLDKGTLGTAAIMGWQNDVGAVGQDYALTSTFLWAGIIVGEPLFCRRLPVAKVLGISMIAWSALVFGLGFCLHIPTIWAIRFLLGFFESTFGPCLVAITVQWFTTHEQTLITTVWQAMFGVAGVTSNLLAYGFYHIKGRDPLRGWQWMNVCIAIISTVNSIVVLFCLPDTPAQARWATDDEKTRFVERVRVNNQGIKQKKWKNEQAKEAMVDPLTYLLFFMMFSQALVVGGLNTFNSILINTAFGFDVLTSLLVSIPLSVFQIGLYFLVGWLGTKFRQTVFTMVGFTFVNIIGTFVLRFVAPTNSSRAGLLVAFYFMQSFQATNPSMYAMMSRNIAGQTKKSIVYMLFFIAWAGGNAIGPLIFQAKWKTRYVNSLYIHLGLYVFFIADIMAMRILLARRNKKRGLAASGEQTETHELAFDDRTDLCNPEFRYSY